MPLSNLRQQTSNANSKNHVIKNGEERGLMHQIDEQTRQFIDEHINDDAHMLMLQSKRYPHVDMALAVRQITGRQKMKHKVPLFFQSDEVLYPVRLSLEQASSQLTAQYKTGLCQGETFIDLTGGMGIDCFFISRNFTRAHYVERQAELCEIARHNFPALGADHITVVNTDAETFLNTVETVDCLFIDPARRSDNGRKLVLLSDCEPDVSRLAPTLLEKATRTLIKLSPMLDLSSATKQLPGIQAIHIIAVENECKEVLLVLENIPTEALHIHTVNFNNEGEQQTFTYEASEESQAQAHYSTHPSTYLYEPNASIMKSGAFKLMSERFHIDKLHTNTHLYTSDRYIADFPGRIFEITANWGNSKKVWKAQAESLGQANVAVRNFPLSADELKKKLKIKDGGKHYLFACTLHNGEKTILACRKVEGNHN